MSADTEPEVFCHVRSYEVTIWPEDCDEYVGADLWCVTVDYRGHGKWAVTRGTSGRGACLRRDGNWVREPNPSEREDEWLASVRYSLDEALALARDWAPRIRTNGLTATEALAATGWPDRGAAENGL